MAHKCNKIHSLLGLYGKHWIRGSDVEGVANMDKRSYALQMDHMTIEHFLLGTAA